MFESIILGDEVRGFLMGCLAFARHDKQKDCYTEPSFLPPRASARGLLMRRRPERSDRQEACHRMFPSETRDLLEGMPRTLVITALAIFQTSSDITGDVRKLPLAGNTAVHPYTGNFRMSPAITHYVRDWHDLYGI